MYDTTVTIFNRIETEDTAFWYPTVIENATLHSNKGANITKTGLENADSSKLHIRLKKESGVYVIETKAGNKKTFINQVEFAKLEAIDTLQYIAFAKGVDFFMEGTYEEKRICEDDYADKDGFFSYMVKTYGEVYQISTADVYKLIPHLEIGGA